MPLGSRLYAIIDTSLAPQPPAVAEQLLRAGVRLLQYRHKTAFGRRRWDDCRAIAEMAARAGALFIVNDRVDIAVLCRAAGIHLGQHDLPLQKARALMPRGTVGYSTHSVEQAREAAAMPELDYIAIGPVFPTQTKANPDPVVGIGGVRAVRAVTSRPLVAIGGITLDNAGDVIRAGADAVAVTRDLLMAGDIESRARMFLGRLGAAP